jgi:UDP-glucose 4-epimerase
MDQGRSETAVVTGGAGFIGSHLCDALIASGNRVICVDDLSGTDNSTRNIEPLLDHPAFTLVNAPVEAWADSADLMGIDCVFHQAAAKKSASRDDPSRDLRVNGLGTLRLLLRAADDGVRKFVHASTGSVYGHGNGRPWTEDSALSPVSFYGASKAVGESYCRVMAQDYGLDVTILRYFHVIGPRQASGPNGGVVPIFVRNCLEGLPLTIYGTGEQTRSFTSVHDIVRINQWAASTPAASGATYNCASGIRVTIRELADFVRAATSASSPVEHADWQPGDVRDVSVDNRRLTELGLTFDTDWRGLVREVIAHMSPVCA